MQVKRRKMKFIINVNVGLKDSSDEERKLIVSEKKTITTGAFLKATAKEEMNGTLRNKRSKYPSGPFFSNLLLDPSPNRLITSTQRNAITTPLDISLQAKCIPFPSHTPHIFSLLLVHSPRSLNGTLTDRVVNKSHYFLE